LPRVLRVPYRNADILERLRKAAASSSATPTQSDESRDVVLEALDSPAN
jgi:hypothetical protein